MAMRHFRDLQTQGELFRTLRQARRARKKTHGATAPTPGGSSTFLISALRRAALANVLIVELTAVVLNSRRNNVTVGFWTDLSRTSLFLAVDRFSQVPRCYVGCVYLSTAAGRPRLRGRACVLIAGLIALISTVTFILGRSDLVTDAGASILFPPDLPTFVIRNVSIGLVVDGTRASLLLRDSRMAPQHSKCRQKPAFTPCRRASGLISCSTA